MIAQKPSNLLALGYHAIPPVKINSHVIVFETLDDRFEFGPLAIENAPAAIFCARNTGTGEEALETVPKKLAEILTGITMTCHLSFPSLFTCSLVMVALSMCCQSSQSQARQSNREESEQATEITPERMGFEPMSIEVDDESVQFFLSTDGKPVDRERKLPLIVFLQGSGATPIYFGPAPKVRSSVMFDSRDFPDCHYVIISKPGVPFYSSEQTIESEEYERRTSLDIRVAAVKSVVEFLVKQPWVDSTQVVLIGHSEGADVGPWAASVCNEVTQLVVLSPGVVSQMLDFTIMERKKVARGEQTEVEAAEVIASNLAAYREIFRDPQNWRKKWYGHSYLRWSTFLRPAMDAYRQLEIPILAVAGRDDRNGPCESAEALELEFIRIGKKNLTFELWPVDHYFVEKSSEGKDIDRRLEVGKRIREWLEASKNSYSN